MINPPPWTSREAQLLAEADRRHSARLTVEEARAIVGPRAAEVLARMARKGLVDRVNRGTYTIRPLRAAGRPWATSALVAVTHLLGATPHYLGGPVALTLNRLTTQSYSSVIDVFLTRERRRRTLASATINFHRVLKARLEVGVVVVEVEETEVRISGPELTVLDAMDNPSAFGGIHAGLLVAREAISKIDPELLVTYALLLARPTSRQRLGVLLERALGPHQVSDRLAAKVTGNNKPAMLPGSRRGPLNRRWNVIENDRTERNGHAATT